MKKICYVTTIPGTIESFFIPQLRYLEKHGFNITVICSDTDTLQHDVGKTIQCIPCQIPRGIALFNSLRAIISLYYIFSREKFDLVQYSTPNAAFCASIAAKMANIPVRNYHLMGLRYLGSKGMLRYILKRLDWFACSLSTHIECVSNSNLKLAIQEKLFPLFKGTVIGHGSTGGIDIVRFDYTKREIYRRAIRETYGIHEEDFVFMFVGRITRDKGINELLQALGKVQGAKLMIVGSEEGVDTLDKALYKQAKKDNKILFTGPTKNIEQYYCAADILVLPSYREGFGNVIIEAAAMGTPAILSAIPGPIDASEKDETALWISPKDVESLRKAMQYCLQHKQQVQQMRKACIKFVHRYFSQDVLNELILERKRKLLS